jgi:uncharacterized OsmC-like protein
MEESSEQNELKLTRDKKGRVDIPLNFGDMKDIHIEHWRTHLNSEDYSPTRAIAAGAMLCISLSMDYELNLLKEGACYNALDSSIQWKNGKDETGRIIIESMEITINVEVPDDLRSEHEKVVKEHMDHASYISRSLRRGIPITININEINP